MKDPREAAMIAAMDAFGQGDLPGRWAAQLVLADWYEERGDARAVGWRWLAATKRTPNHSVSGGMEEHNPGSYPAFIDTCDWWRINLAPWVPWPASHPDRLEHGLKASVFACLPEELFDLVHDIAANVPRDASGRLLHYCSTGFVESLSILSAELLVVTALEKEPCIAHTLPSTLYCS